MAELKAIGVLETKGLVPLIEGADAAVKAANVELVEWKQLSEKAVATRFADGTEVVADHATQTLRVNGKEVSSRQACPPGGATAGQIAG